MFAFLTTPEILLPPARYLEGPAPAEVRLLPQADVLSACGHYTRHSHDPVDGMGCSLCTPTTPCVSFDGPRVVIKTDCIVILPTWATWRGSATEYANANIHEVGHCHGWPADHPL